MTRDTCLQVRQWQHWGSGCYNYACEDSRLHILILNHTYTCYHPGQELKVTSMGTVYMITLVPQKVPSEGS